MATKYTVSGKAYVAQASHEREKRQTNVGSSWDEVRIGFIGGIVPVASDDAASILEDVVINSYIDWFCFGLINNVITIPGQVGTQFVGMATKATADGTYTGTRVTSNAAGAGVVSLYKAATTYNQMNYTSRNGVTVITDGAAGEICFPFPIYSPGGGALFALKFVVANKGASNQTITISCANPGTNVVVTPLNAKATLKSLLGSATFAAAGTVNWFSGGVALPLPDTWFLRAPFTTNRIRWAVKGGMII